MKVIKRVLKVILCSILLSFAINVYGEPIESASSYKIVLEDDANLLTDEEENKLKDQMAPLSEYGNIIFKSIDINNTTAEYFASEYYHRNYATQSGSLFLIDMDTRQIYIFSDGDNYNVITTGKALIITDNIYRYASNGEYYLCASEAFSQMEALLAGKKIMEPMRHASNAALAIVLAFFINFFVILITSKTRKAKQADIIKNCDISFAISNISGLKIGTHRVYSPVSSDSGGSSGGGGGGGGSSGGGGGHSF